MDGRAELRRLPDTPLGRQAPSSARPGPEVFRAARTGHADASVRRRLNRRPQVATRITGATRTHTRGATRTAMLESAVAVLRERGAAGLTIDAVLARSGTPRGSVYHHFPGGRGQLLRQALEFAGDEITAKIDQAADVSATALLRQFVELWSGILLDSDYTAGNPVLAAAIGWGQEDQELTVVAAGIFRRWRDAARATYVREGFAPAQATALAHTTISALEGAAVLCRSMRSLEPLNDVAHEIEFLIKARKFVSRP